MAKKLTKRQAFKLVKQIGLATRKLMIDKLDHGTDSNVKMSVDALSKLSQRTTTNVLLKR